MNTGAEIDDFVSQMEKFNNDRNIEEKVEDAQTDNQKII